MAGKTIAYLNVLLGADSRRLTSALDSSEKAVKRFGSKLQSIGSELSMKVTAPLTAIGVASIGVASTFSDSMLKVKALSGATGEEFNLLNAKAKELGSSTKFTASQVGDAMGFMALAGYNTNQTLAATPSILALAAASATDLAATSDILTDTMSAYGIEAEKANTVSDLFAQTQAKANTNVLQLGEAFKYVAPNMASANQSITDTASILSVLANNGFKGSMAGTAINAMLKDLKANSKNGAIAIAGTSVAIYDQAGAMRSVVDIMQDLEKATTGLTQEKKDLALATLFEERSIKAVNIMLNSGINELRRYQSELGNSEGAAQRMAEEMESGLGGSLRRMKSNLEGLGIVIGENLTPTVLAFSKLIQRTTDIFLKLDAGTQKTIITIGALVAGVGPALFVFGKMIVATVGLIAQLKTLAIMSGVSKVAISSFGVALQASIWPITATVGALYALYKAGEYFNKGAKINKDVTDKLKVSFDKLNNVKKDAKTITDQYKTASEGIKNMTEQERIELVKLYNQKIHNVKLDLLILQSQAKQIAMGAMQLTMWEKGLNVLKGFGQVGSVTYFDLQKKAEKYNEAIQGSSGLIGETEKALNDLMTTVNSLNEGFNMDGSIASVGELGKSFETAREKFDRLADIRNEEIRLEIDAVKLNEDHKSFLAQLKEEIDSKINSLNAITLKKIDVKVLDLNIDLGDNPPQIEVPQIDDSSKTKLLLSAKELNTQLSDMFADFGVNMTADLISGFAQMAVGGGDGVKAFASSILGNFGSFLIQMGKMGLMYSKFAIAIKAAFANPAVGIPASIALIAVGGAMKGLAGNIGKSVSSGGSGSGFSSAGSGSSFNSSYLNDRGIGNSKVEFEVQGDRLVGVLENANRFRRRF